MDKRPSRYVVVQLTVEYVKELHVDLSVPEIDFLMNESSSCKDNLITDLVAVKRAKVGDACFCGQATAKYLREATREDLERDGFAGPGRGR